MQIWWRQGILKEKKVYFRLTCVTQKRLCLNSLVLGKESILEVKRSCLLFQQNLTSIVGLAHVLPLAPMLGNRIFKFPTLKTLGGIGTNFGIFGIVNWTSFGQ